MYRTFFCQMIWEARTQVVRMATKRNASTDSGSSSIPTIGLRDIQRMQTDETTSLCDTRYKVVFLGDMSVGKTSVIERFVKDQFDTHNNPTVGIDFLSRNITFANRVFRLQLWDTAGQQKYKSLVPAYLRDSHCAAFVFDLDRMQSLDCLKDWLQLFRDHRTEDTVAMLVGNKADLMPSSPEMKEAITAFAEREGLHYHQVSAKTGEHIDELFSDIVRLLYKAPVPENSSQFEPEVNQFFLNYNKIRWAAEMKSSCCYL